MCSRGHLSACTYLVFLCRSLFTLISSFYKDTSHIAVEAILTTHFQRNYLFKGPIVNTVMF